MKKNICCFVLVSIILFSLSESIRAETSLERLLRKVSNNKSILSLDGSNFDFPYARFCADGYYGYRDRKCAIMWAGESMKTTFTLKDLSHDLLLELKGINGDHLDSPFIEIVFNGNLLAKGISPFENMFRWEKDMPEDWKSFYLIIPKVILKESNTLELRSSGPDWLMLEKMDIKAIDVDISPTYFFPETENERIIRAVKTSSPPQIDGKTDEPIWQETPVIYLNQNLEGENQTEVRLIYDENNLYVGFKSYDKNMPEITNKSVDNCVQVLLNTNPEDDKGYHSFTLNADGKKYAGKSSDEFPKDFAWQAKANIGPSFWTAEFVIPYQILDDVKEQYYQYDSSLKLFFPAGYTWQINFLRKRSCQFKFYDCYSWSGFTDPKTSDTIYSFTTIREIALPIHHFYQPARFGLLANLRVDFYKRDYTPIEVLIEEPLLGENILSGKIKKGYELENEMKLTAEIKSPSGMVSQTSQLLFYNKEKGADFKLKYGVIEPGEQHLTLSLTSNKSGEIVAQRTYQIAVPDPLRITLDRSYYTDENEANLEISPQINKSLLEKTKLSVEVRKDWIKGALLNRTEHLIKSDDFKIPLEISKLSSGTYKVVSSLVGPEGERLYSYSLTMKKYPKRKGEVKFRSDGMMLVDGNLFFPYGVYVYSYVNSSGEESLKDIAETGFNTVTQMQMKGGETNILSYLDTAHSLGLKVMDSTGTEGPIVKTETDFESIRKSVELRKNHPSFLCYYLIDEPDTLHTANATGDNLLKVDRFIKELDPYHPTFITISMPGHITYHNNWTISLGDAVDIIAPDPYPIPDDPNEVTYEVKNTVRGLRNKRAIPWVVEQSFPRLGRGPTAEETRFMAYLAIVHGAKGILYFWHKYMKELPYYPDSYKQIAKEIKFLTPIIAAPTSKEKILTQPKTVDMLLKEYAGKKYLIAVNTEKEKVAFQFILPGTKWKKIIKVLFEDREIKLSQNSFVDKFESHGVHIYEIE